MAWGAACLGAALVLTAVRTAATASEAATVSTVWFATGAVALGLLQRLLTARAAQAVRWALVATALGVVGWLLLHPASPRARVAGAMVALGMALAPWSLWPALGVGVWMSQSYVAIAAAAAGLLARPTPRRSFLSSVVLVCAITGLAVLWLMRPTPPSWHGRWLAWQVAWPDMRAHPWLGLGPGGWVTTIPVRQLTGSGAEVWPHAHADVLQWAYEEGLVGLALLGGWVASHARGLWRSDARGAVVALAVISTGFTAVHEAALIPWTVLVLGLGLREETV